MPDIPHVACFDTAFHATLPEVAWRYPVPDRWHDEWGVRRYGFHGLSVEWAIGQASEQLGRPVRSLDLVVAHLGGGCSVTAARGGRSAWTSMGLTPLEGLMMATRSGSIDPGALVLALRRGLAADELEAVLDHDSGLRAVGGSGDLRVVEKAARDGDARARLAIAMFVDRAAAEIAAAATRLRRIDALVFTGGIGEHATRVRTTIVDRLAALRFGTPAPPVLVVEAREDLVIARAAFRLAGRG
jgi:acetate kinase